MNRRLLARVCIVTGFLCLAGEAIAAIVPGHHVRALGFTTALSAIGAIGGGLIYLRSTRRAVRSRHGTSKSDRAAWGSARTLSDLGELTAQWIEGRIASQPGYCGPSDIEDPALVPLLAALNRAGFVTTGSQFGESGPGYDGAHWDQRAAVEGFTGRQMAVRLVRAARQAGLSMVLHSPEELPRWRYRYHRAVVVTRRAGEDRTRFGVQAPRRHIRDPHLGYGICHPDAVNALCEAWQVTVIDPEWGRPDVLWRVLEQAIQPAGGTS